MQEGFKAFGCLIVCGVLLFAVGIGCVVLHYAGRTAAVADKEFGPEASLRKYEEFKDMSAKLDAKKASIQVHEVKLAGLAAIYEGVARKDWARADIEQSNIWNQELAGMKASYNDLASRYNSNMAKFNYAFANAGELPKGADKPLPREFKSYETK